MKTIDKLQKIVLAVMTLICCAAIAIAYNFRAKPHEVEYTPPSFENEAIEGAPEAGELAAYGTMEIPLSSGSCKVSMDAAPKLNDQNLEVYFTNEAGNDVWLKLIIYDAQGDVVGESGILRSGEYVKSVVLNEAVADGEKLGAKILTYEADTYYSLGAAGATILVR